MMKQNLQIFLKIIISLIVIVFILSSFLFKKQNLKQYIVKANSRGLSDSIPFTPNTAEGWGTYSSYLKIEEDSIEFEVILKRKTPDNNDWSAPSLIGTIYPIYTPASVRIMTYTEPNRSWEITIQPDAGCYLKLLSSNENLDSMVVIPIKTKYKQ